MYNVCMIYLREQFEKIKFTDFENVKEEQGYDDRDRIARREVLRETVSQVF